MTPRSSKQERPDRPHARPPAPADAPGRQGWRAERALRTREERYRLVVRATNSAIWDWDLRTNRVAWDGESRLLRYRAGELEETISWWYGRLHPEDRGRVIADLQTALEGGTEFWTAEYRFRRGDDTYALLLGCAYIMRDERGKAVRVISSLQDVTERRRVTDAQTFLARASALLDSSLDHEVTLGNLARLAVPAQAACCIVDLLEDTGALRRVAVAHVDPQREELLRRRHDGEDDAAADSDEALLLRIMYRGDPVLVSSCADDVLDGGGVRAVLARRLAALGVASFLVVPLRVHERPLGTLTLASESYRYTPADLVVAEDLGRRAALAVEHARLYDEAQRAISARDEMLRVISHDLRNPVNTIQLAAALLLQTDTERRKDKVRPLETIRRTALQMNDMIQDLLDVSTEGRGVFAVNRTDRSIDAVIREAAELLQPIADQQSIDLEFEIEPGLPVLSLDGGGMLRVFSNLIGNAIKFTPEGGRIMIRTERAGSEIVFSVSDEGDGISAADVPHVFERYWQGRQGDRRGVGLGLAIAKGIVEAHGGRIWVESGADRGATFSFALPAPGAAEDADNGSKDADAG